MRVVAKTIALLIVGGALMAWAQVPTTIDDFFLPGSQPGETGNLETPDKCDNCHGGYDPTVEQAFVWRGSMMSQAMRDPLFLATMTIANQDAPESGDLCIRCHTPQGWLEGRSIPTDGSALTASDREGVTCDFCHKLVTPSPVGVNPYPNDSAYNAETFAADQNYLATMSTIPTHAANGMYITDSDNSKRGPYVEAEARHQYLYSPLHPSSALCGTCHDVSNPAFTRDSSGAYVPNTFGSPAPDFDPRSMFPVERTYSEWLHSAYNTPEGVYAPQFGGNKDTVRTCQDCHLKDVTGVGCNKNGAPERDDLPLHDMTGGNTFVPLIIESVFPGETDPAALDAGIARARGMLQKAASMQLTVTESGDSLALTVRVVNETGHKLPSGYPEGRRIWLNIQVFDSSDQLIYESGAYDSTTAVLTHDAAAKVYEIKPGISNSLSGIIGLPAGPSFHFVLNDTVYSDNRIPPRGFTNVDYTTIQSPPVAYSYADGQFWDDTDYMISPGAVRIFAKLLYQTTSKEYIEFLRDENVTDDWGDTLYSLWSTFGMSAPEVMLFDSLLVTPPSETCCEDRRGNVDGIIDGNVDIDIGDLVWLVDYMFTGGPVPPCTEEANIDGSCCAVGTAESLSDIDIADLVTLVDFMFTGGPPPVDCP
ncbi:MAG: multiheme c-type cytochrome [candidate division Zixibacteria bacterium]|nr:multiheme c-type cytochrome [candidate division Zixibacteria bacterium]MDH3937080.1 multiheme c-type cytochrome [candidate division Zixibacteria bacterium]MDH4033618.1 multiheme c-type cytochrome [candidate division Zixibacteria bacterium]